MFLNGTEDLAPAEVDVVIDMKIAESLEEGVRRAVGGVVKVLGLPPPSEEQITEGLNAVENYKPGSRKPDEKKRRGDPTRYYALLPELDLFEYLDNLFGSIEAEEELKSAWDLLKQGNRVTERPHVTIVHKNNIEAERALWDRCAALHAMPVNPPMFQATLGKLMWNGRVMAITVEDLTLEDAGAVAGQGEDFLSELPARVSHRLHITVGTAKSSISPVEAKEMVEGSKDGVIIQSLDDTKIRGQIKGLFG